MRSPAASMLAAHGTPAGLHLREQGDQRRRRSPIRYRRPRKLMGSKGRPAERPISPGTIPMCFSHAEGGENTLINWKKHVILIYNDIWGKT